MKSNLVRTAVAALAALGLLATPARADEGGDPTKKMIQDEIKAYMKAEKEKKAKEDEEKGVMKVSWKDGLSFESADKKVKFKITGRIQVDYVNYASADEELEDALSDDFESCLGFRRARLGVEGTVCKHWVFKAEYEFARGAASNGDSSAATFTDVYVGARDLDECVRGIPDVTIGHFREPFSLDELTSSRNITFMERATPVLTFAPSRNTGLMLENCYCNERIFWQAGVFGANSNSWGDGVFSDGREEGFFGDADGWAVTGRVGGRPWVDACCPETKWLHLAGAVSYRDDLRADDVRFRTRIPFFCGPRVIDTGAYAANGILLAQAEFALLLNRFHAQGEYIMADVDAPTAGDPQYTAWYVQAGYFLTGEPRTFKPCAGAWDKVKPCRPFWCGDCCGCGAWEVAARYAMTDLDDGTNPGGTLADLTLGLNWYINTNFKVMLNYVWGSVEDARGRDADGDVHAFGIRFQAWW